MISFYRLLFGAFLVLLSVSLSVANDFNKIKIVKLFPEDGFAILSIGDEKQVIFINQMLFERYQLLSIQKNSLQLRDTASADNSIFIVSKKSVKHIEIKPALNALEE